MSIAIASRVGVKLSRALKGITGPITRNLSVSFARSDNLAKSIAQALLNGKKVVLLDVDYRAPLFSQKKTIEKCVKDELGTKAGLAKEVINLDHHTQEFGHKTATELVFDNLDMLRKLEGDVAVMINHGDTDSILSSYVANNLDRKFSADGKKLLIAAARAGDHSEGDFLAPTGKLAQGVKLNLALDAICSEHGLFLHQIWKTKDAQISQGVQTAYSLVDRALNDRRLLHTVETEALIKKNPIRYSYQIVEDAAQGKNVPGVSIDRSVKDYQEYPIVIVDASTPGLDNFNPIPAYSTSLEPAIIIIVRNGRAVGIGRNKNHSAWMSLTGSGINKSVYERFGMRIKGGAHAGGANVQREAFDTLPTPEEALEIAKQLLQDEIAVVDIVDFRDYLAYGRLTVRRAFYT